MQNTNRTTTSLPTLSPKSRSPYGGELRFMMYRNDGKLSGGRSLVISKKQLLKENSWVYFLRKVTKLEGLGVSKRIFRVNGVEIVNLPQVVGVRKVSHFFFFIQYCIFYLFTSS